MLEKTVSNNKGIIMKLKELENRIKKLEDESKATKADMMLGVDGL